MIKILIANLILLFGISCDKQATTTTTDQVATGKGKGKENCKDDPLENSKVPEFNENGEKKGDGMSFGEDSGEGQKGCKVK